MGHRADGDRATSPDRSSVVAVPVLTSGAPRQPPETSVHLCTRARDPQKPFPNSLTACPTLDVQGTHPQPCEPVSQLMELELHIHFPRSSDKQQGICPGMCFRVAGHKTPNVFYSRPLGRSRLLTQPPALRGAHPKLSPPISGECGSHRLFVLFSRRRKSWVVLETVAGG